MVQSYKVKHIYDQISFVFVKTLLGDFLCFLNLNWRQSIPEFLRTAIEGSSLLLNPIERHPQGNLFSQVI